MTVKTKLSKSNRPRRYPKAQYTKDIRSGVNNYVNSIRMVTMTNNILLKLNAALEEKEKNGVEIDVEHTDAIQTLINAVDKTITTLEEIETNYISCPPSHLSSNSLKVDEWNLNLHGEILDATTWMGSCNDIYRTIIETYDVDLSTEQPTNEIEEQE